MGLACVPIPCQKLENRRPVLPLPVSVTAILSVPLCASDSQASTARLRFPPREYEIGILKYVVYPKILY
jgi:hypothetical protein